MVRWSSEADATPHPHPEIQLAARAAIQGKTHGLRAILPFLEKDGKYWGPPADDKTAIGELQRLRSSGAKYIAFVWSTFWWLDHYRQFAEHLRKHAACVAENADVIIFDLTVTA